LEAGSSDDYMTRSHLEQVEGGLHPRYLCILRYLPNSFDNKACKSMEDQWINARPKWEPVENASTCSEEETENHLDSPNTGNLEDVWSGLRNGVKPASGRQGWTPILLKYTVRLCIVRDVDCIKGASADCRELAAGGAHEGAHHVWRSGGSRESGAFGGAD
jgi:hypothetical protein